ncbi:MAG: S9 family peptidase, partial [Candidatus Eisenbacteria bacterium]|nr:S9 family peptidase [Candidatus Eisenbacteria bacterium]
GDVYKRQIYNQNGTSHLARLDLETRELTPIPLTYTDLDSPHTTYEGIGFLGSSPTEPRSVLLLERGTNRPNILRRAGYVLEDPRFGSHPQAIEFPTTGGRTAHAFFYPPANPNFEAPAGELPPLIVESHGGPTSATTASLDLGVQYWTSRGFAVLDVNYGGSTGYGRAYRERLDGEWGVVDVDDCVNGARYLVERGLVDGKRLAIRGGSAGGYTTLCALTFRDVFHAGADYYGVSDLAALDEATHKFEARYNDSLIGPRPERAHLYRERSPIHFPERISCPVIFFQGLDDPIVPPEQSERMYEALRARGIPTAYLGFPGEQHGFRRAENIKRTLEAELYFYGRIFGFEPADRIEPVTIENEEKLRK